MNKRRAIIVIETISLVFSFTLYYYEEKFFILLATSTMHLIVKYFITYPLKRSSKRIAADSQKVFLSWYERQKVSPQGEDAILDEQEDINYYDVNNLDNAS